MKINTMHELNKNDFKIKISNNLLNESNKVVKSLVRSNMAEDLEELKELLYNAKSNSEIKRVLNIFYS